ncbi:MAG: ribose-phosphate diphosphokinase, partial [Bacteroidetes bacterium]|nr:ribose-phosphate diphosphokinase [Bacteroidota bacterium]
AIGAKLVANLLTAAGITRIMTMDLHADQIQGFFDVPVDHLFASAIFMPYLEELGLDNLSMGSPDTGGTRRANAYAKHLDSELVICYKQRKKANEIDSMSVIGDVKGKHIIMVDDIIDTGTYTVTLTAYNYNCSDVATYVIIVIDSSEPVDTSVGINEFQVPARGGQAGLKFQVFPNPNNGQFTIEVHRWS